MVQPRLPKGISPFARSCIDALAGDDLGRRLSLGGAFGLAHYHEYRPTHGVHAWWRQPIEREEQDAVIRALTRALTSFGSVRTRSWGEVVSVELEQGGKTVFSFQIAHRSAQIDAPIDGVWPGGLGVDSFDELVASKMRALVERGAPRDFRDIHSLCMAGLCSVARCWQLWETRQRLAHEDADGARARNAIVTHLSRLAEARPLDRITEAEQRENARGLRAWFERVSRVSFRIDGSLYPDEPPPVVLRSLAERIDYFARLCSAWDFGILPEGVILREIRRGRWRKAVDRCRLVTSPTYHLLRKWHRLPPLPYLGTIPAFIKEDPNLEFV